MTHIERVMGGASMRTEPKPSRGRSAPRYFLLLFALCIPVWLLGLDVELFPGFKVFQLGLAMPATAALILVARDEGWAGIVALLKRTGDVVRIKPRLWFLPILLLYPSLGLINYFVVRATGTQIPSPTFSLVGFLGYCTVFVFASAEELGLTGYAIEPLQKRHGALSTGLILGLVWAGYHIPGFVISGYYTTGWIVAHSVYLVATRVLFVWIYNNSGKSLFAMALCHWTFGLFWSFWPQTNLQMAVPFYVPAITATAAVVYVLVVVYLWGPQTLSRNRFGRRNA